MLKGVGHAIRQRMRVTASGCVPCGKQHFREIPTPDFVRTLRPYPILNSMLDSYIYLQNPAWVFRGNVVSHMGCVCRKHNMMLHAHRPVLKGVVPGRVKGRWACDTPAHEGHNIRVCLSKTQDVSLENTTRSVEMRCLSKTQHDRSR